MLMAAELYRNGGLIPGEKARDPVNVVFNAEYKTALKWHELLLERDDLEPELRGELHAHAGRLAMSLHKFKNEFDINIGLTHLKSSTAFDGQGAMIGCSLYGRYLYDQKDYEQAIPLLERASETIPAAAGLMATIYEKGLGVKSDKEKAEHFMTLFYGEQ